MNEVNYLPRRFIWTLRKDRWIPLFLAIVLSIVTYLSRNYIDVYLLELTLLIALSIVFGLFLTSCLSPQVKTDFIKSQKVVLILKKYKTYSNIAGSLLIIMSLLFITFPNLLCLVLWAFVFGYSIGSLIQLFSISSKFTK